MDLLQHKQFDLKELSQFEIGESAFDVCDPEESDVYSLFVQTGCLIIKGFNAPLCVLDFPNYEVKESLLNGCINFKTLTQLDSLPKLGDDAKAFSDDIKKI